MYFAATKESDVTRAILEGFSKDLAEVIESDCIIVGAGPAGLMAGSFLARQGFNVVIVEQNNYLGGGFWIGGYFMNSVTFRHPSQLLLDELGIPYKRYQDGLSVAAGPQACSKLIAHACDAGVRFLQLTFIDDVVLKNNRVCGAVVNWSPVRALPRQITCVDPVALETKIVIDASGHDAVVVKKLEKRGLVKMEGLKAMWVDASEDALVEKTGEIFPGLFIAGMAVAETHGLPRMGPTFGSMLVSGRRAGELVAYMLGKRDAISSSPA